MEIKNMNKILPINLNTGFTISCSNFYKLAVILSDEKFKPWFLERFIYYIVKDNVFIYDYGLYSNCLTSFDEVLNVKKLSYKKDNIETIRLTIEEDGYVLMYCDEFFIMGSENFNKNHFLHEILIYGINEDLKVVYFVDTHVNSKVWGTGTLEYDYLINSCNSFINIIRNDINKYAFIYEYYLPICALYLKKDYIRDQPRLELIYESIFKCLNGGEIIYNKLIGNDKVTHKEYMGISSYKFIYNLIEERIKTDSYFCYEKDYNLVWALKAITESKQGLLLRLEYINYNIMPLFSDDLLTTVKSICLNLNLASSLLVKHMHSFSSEDILKVLNLIQNVEVLDIKALTTIKEILYKNVILKNIVDIL